MNKRILEALAPLGYPVLYGWYDKSLNKTHITFFQNNELPNDYSEDTNEVLEHYFQIDIWSKENVEKLKRNVRKAMIKAGFKYTDGRDQFETDTKIYHKALRFYIAEIDEGDD